MPKHGWKWRTERVRGLTIDQIGVLLREGRVSARLGRWIYEHLLKDSDTLGPKIAAIERIADDEAATWARSFLWRELERQKAEAFGDWLVIALTRSYTANARDAEKFIALYEDESAHPMTRGSAVFGLNSAVECGQHQLSEEIMMRVRATCARALRDQANPYARAGACWLGSTLGGFDDDLAVLAKDRTPISEHDSLTVADHCD